MQLTQVVKDQLSAMNKPPNFIPRQFIAGIYIQQVDSD